MKRWIRFVVLGGLICVPALEVPAAEDCSPNAPYRSVCNNSIKRPSELPRGGGSSGTSAPRGGNSNAGNAANVLGILGNMLDTMSAMRQGEINRLRNLSADANARGIWLAAQGRDEEAMEAYAEAAEYAYEAGDEENFEINRKNGNAAAMRIEDKRYQARLREAERQAAIDKAKDDAKRKGYDDPFAKSAYTPGTNPNCIGGVNCYDAGGANSTPPSKSAAPDKAGGAKGPKPSQPSAADDPAVAAQIAALEKSVSEMPPGDERDRLSKLLNDIKAGKGGGSPGPSEGGDPPEKKKESPPPIKKVEAPPVTPPQLPPGKLSPEVEQALKDRPAAGTYYHYSADECRRLQGKWSDNGSWSSCNIGP